MEINQAWENAVSLDCSLRLAGTGERIIDINTANNRSPHSPVIIRNPDTTIILNRKKLPVPDNNTERSNRALQTILTGENPVCPNQLDSIFRSLLAKQHIRIPTAVAYLHDVPGNRIRYSISDTAFIHSAFATREIKTGIDNSIILRGYAGISFLQNIRYAKDLYAGWGMIMAGLLFLLHFLWKKRTSVLIPNAEITELVEENSEVNTPATGPCKEIVFARHKSEIRCGDKRIELTYLECSLFYLLMQGENYSSSYETLMNCMWPGGDGEKKKLEQQCRNLRIKLEQIPAVQIKANRGYGYYLTIDEAYQICFE